MDQIPGPGWVKVIFFVILIFCLIWPAAGAGNSTLAQQTPGETTNAGTPLLTSTLPADSSPITMTVNTARKVQLIQGVGPENGLWLIIDLSLENTGFDHGYAFSKTNFILVDRQNGLNSTPTYRHIHLSDPFTDGGILPLNTTERGEIAFIANVSPDAYLLVLSDTNGRILAQSEIQAMQINDYDPTFAYTEVPPGQLSTLVPRGYGWSGGHNETPIIPSVVPTGREITVTTILPVTTIIPVTMEPVATESPGMGPDLPFGQVAAALAGVCVVGGGILAIRSYLAKRPSSPAIGKNEDISVLPPQPAVPAGELSASREEAPGEPVEEKDRPDAAAMPEMAVPVPVAGKAPEDAARVAALQEEARSLRKKASALRFYGSLVTARLSTTDEALRAGDTGTGRGILSECSAFIDQLRGYESRIDTWQSAGYITAPLETITPGDPQKIADEFRKFEDNILRLERLKDLLGELKLTRPALDRESGINEKIRSLEEGLNNPARVDQAESAFRHLNEDLELERERWEMEELAAERKELKARAAELLAEAEPFGEVPGPVKAIAQSDDTAALRDAVRGLESFLSTVKPDLVPQLETQHFNVGSWHKAEIRITNTGAAHAYDVRISFSEDIEIRRLRPVQVMAGETIALEIGMMPRTGGNIPIEITLACHDHHGKEYTTVHELWIVVTGRAKAHGIRGDGNEPEEERALHAIDVFISYSHQDKNVADAVCNALESDKVRCWVAPRDILPGMQFQESIIDAIDASSIMVIILSSHSNISPHVISEVTEAMSKGVIIIPFRIEDVLPSKAMKYLIGASHWLDALTPPLEHHIDTLVHTVKVLLENQDK